METQRTDIGGEPPRPEFPERRGKSALGFFLAVLALDALLGSGAQTLHPALGLAWTEVFVFLLPAFAAAAGSNLSPGRFLLLSPPPRPLHVAVGAGLGAALFLASSGVMALTTLLLPASWVERFDLTRLFLGSGAQRLAMALIASVLAPVAEELAFRGYAQSALRTRTRPWPAILGAGVLFAVVHVDPVRFPAVLLLGVAFGWLSWRSGSIWPAVAAHAVHNGLGSAMMATSGEDSGADASLPGALALLSLGLAAATPLALFFWRATPEPPDGAEALVPLNPGDPSIRFRLSRVPRRYLVLAVAGAALLAALAAWGGWPPPR